MQTYSCLDQKQSTHYRLVRSTTIHILLIIIILLVLVFGDPHVTLAIAGSDKPLCFEVTEDDQQVLEFFSLAKQGKR